MATITLTASGTTNIYGLRGTNSSYSTARTTYYSTDSAETSQIGQTFISPNYYVYRSFPLFDMSAISGTATYAKLMYTGVTGNDHSDTDFDMQARAFTESALASNTASYIGYGSTVFGSLNTSSFSTVADGMVIEFNSSGLSYITNCFGGNCVVVLTSSRDIGSSTPSGEERISLYSSETSTAAKRPHLYLEYTEASTWTPKIMMIMSPLVDGFLDYIRKPITADKYLQI